MLPGDIERTAEAQLVRRHTADLNGEKGSDPFFVSLFRVQGDVSLRSNRTMHGFGRSRSGSPKLLQHSHFEVAKMETASRNHVFNLPVLAAYR